MAPERQPGATPAGAEDGGRCLTFRELLSISLGPAGSSLAPLDLDHQGLLPGMTVRLQLRSLDGFQVELRLPRAAAPGTPPRSWLGRIRDWAAAVVQRCRRRARPETGAAARPVPGGPELVIDASRSGSGAPDITWRARVDTSECDKS